MQFHPKVRHPQEVMTDQKLTGLNAWVTDHLTLALGSLAGMYVAFLVPLIALPIPAVLKYVALISSNWIQLWALFVLQRSANVADAKREAKNVVDHEAMTHIATVLDQLAGHPRLTAGDILEAKRKLPPDGE